VGCKAFETFAADFIVGDVESFEFGGVENEGIQMAFPIIVTLFAEVVVLDDELPEFVIGLEGVEDFDEALGGDVISFNFEGFDSGVLL
jgi:hypothetical protein